ncbi:hypothetical protein HGM15179_002293, partial [Zosterops borbonicus]
MLTILYSTFISFVRIDQFQGLLACLPGSLDFAKQFQENNGQALLMGNFWIMLAEALSSRNRSERITEAQWIFPGHPDP